MKYMIQALINLIIAGAIMSSWANQRKAERTIARLTDRLNRIEMTMDAHEHRAEPRP